jgi:membrane fusion protein (multidrug efflux system)
MPEPSNPGPRPDLFREDAMRYHLAESEEGDVIRLSPLWTRWTYWFLLLTVVAGLFYLILGRVWVYESGPAIVQLSARSSLTSTSDGTVESVELERVRDPTDLVSGGLLQRLVAEKKLLEAELEQRKIRAPHDGVVHDVRIRNGQFIAAGSTVLDLVPPDAGYDFIAMMPGHTSPQLKEQMSLRLEITGYPYADVPTTIEIIGNQVIGPTEARRFLRPDIADSFPLTGPVIVVQGRLKTGTFQAGAQEYSLLDGMQATAEVKVRRERILLRLIPGLKRLRRSDDA